MKKFLTCILILASCEQSPDLKHESPLLGKLQVMRGQKIFSDDFERKDLGSEWTEHFKTISIKDGWLNVNQEPDLHPAIARHTIPLHNNIIDFQLKLNEGARRAVLVLNGERGHICHASFVPREDGVVVSVKDYANPKTISSKKIGKLPIYNVTVILKDSNIEVLVNSQTVVSLSSPDLDTPKQLFQLNGVGTDLQYDNVSIYKIGAL